MDKLPASIAKFRPMCPYLQQQTSRLSEWCLPPPSQNILPSLISCSKLPNVLLYILHFLCISINKLSLAMLLSLITLPLTAEPRTIMRPKWLLWVFVLMPMPILVSTPSQTRSRQESPCFHSSYLSCARHQLNHSIPPSCCKHPSSPFWLCSILLWGIGEETQR